MIKDAQSNMSIKNLSISEYDTNICNVFLKLFLMLKEKDNNVWRKKYIFNFWRHKIYFKVQKLENILLLLKNIFWFFEYEKYMSLMFEVKNLVLIFEDL